MVVDTVKCASCHSFVPSYWLRNGGTLCRDCQRLTGKKICPRCKTEKNLSEFHKQYEEYCCWCKICQKETRHKHYLANRNKIAVQRKEYVRRNRNKIKARQRRWNWKRLCNVTPEEVRECRIKQNNRCAICQEERVLKVDHCHVTKRFRGLLCHSCNVSLGHFQDNPDILMRAIQYLTEK